MFGGDMLPMTTDVRGMSLWSADKADPNIFPISPEPPRPANKSSDRRAGAGSYGGVATAPSSSGSGAAGLNNLQLHDNDAILLPPSGSAVGGTNEGPNAGSNSQLQHVVASSNIFSEQGDLHGAAASSSSSNAIGNLQTQIDYMAGGGGGGVNGGAGDESESPLHLSVFPSTSSSGSSQTLNLTMTPATLGSSGASKLPSSILSLHQQQQQQQQQPQQQQPQLQQGTSLSATSSSSFIFSTAGNQQLVPTTSVTATSTKNLPQLVDNSRRALQLYVDVVRLLFFLMF